MTTDFTPPVLEYLLVQGDTFRDGFFVTEFDPVTETYIAKDLSSCRIDVSIRTKMDKDATLLANINTVDGGVVITNGNGTNDYFEYTFSDVQTNSLPVRRVYMDIQVKFPSQDSITFLKAEVDVFGQATPVLS
jgi:hypothetical protein